MSVEIHYKLSARACDHFSLQWAAHRKDLTEGHWTNMTLVGVSSDGTYSSVKVTLQLQERKKCYFEIIFLGLN